MNGNLPIVQTTSSSVVAIFLCLLFCACNKKQQKSDWYLDFNLKAKASFASDFLTYDLQTMNDQDICILKDGISRYLDEMNSQKIVIVDSFRVRNYHDEDLGIQFSFVAVHDKFYFIYLPTLYEYYYSDRYYIRRNSMHELRGSEYAAIRINSSMLEKFLNEQAPHELRQSDGIRQMSRLMPVIFPELAHHPMSLREFKQALVEEPEANRICIYNTLSNLMNGKEEKSENTYLISEIKPIGYIVFDFSQRYMADGGGALDVYLVAHQARGGILGTFEIDRSRHPDCYTE